SIAYDSLGENDGTCHGEPLWVPDGGKVGGALQLDGIDDYVESDFILNPALGSFSAFAWIKGGEPGHVIISQTGSNGGTWLGTNPSNGKLMTGLGGTYFGVLESESVIADGQWHHVGLVYDFDALHRRLYVDGAQVAEDATFVAPQPSTGGLNLGASKDLDAASFFSGLIDDIRIYNRVISP
ncbi:MAG: LamG domain-containing protein, partial [Phycisphaerales bacterium]